MIVSPHLLPQRRKVNPNVAIAANFCWTLTRFYRWGNWGMEWSSDFLNISLLERNRSRIPTQELGLSAHMLTARLPCLSKSQDEIHTLYLVPRAFPDLVPAWPYPCRSHSLLQSPWTTWRTAVPCAFASPSLLPRTAFILVAATFQVSGPWVLLPPERLCTPTSGLVRVLWAPWPPGQPAFLWSQETFPSHRAGPLVRTWGWTHNRDTSKQQKAKLNTSRKIGQLLRCNVFHFIA